MYASVSCCEPTHRWWDIGYCSVTAPKTHLLSRVNAAWRRLGSPLSGTGQKTGPWGCSDGNGRSGAFLGVSE